MLQGRLRFLLSVPLLAEYRAVLLRPKIGARHGLSAEEVDVLLARLAENGILREGASTHPAPDPGDDHLWSLLAALPGTVLVTGDTLLLEQPPAGASVVSPASYLALTAARVPGRAGGRTTRRSVGSSGAHRARRRRGS